MGILRNPRHEKFANLLVEGRSAAEAYRLSGYSPNEGNCIRLKGNERVRERIAELQAKAARRNEITLDSLADELDAAVAQAEALGQPSVRVSAAALKARLAGLDIKRIETGSPGSFNNIATEAELLDKLCEGSDLHEVLAMVETVRETLLERIASQATLVEPPVDHRDRGWRR